MSKELIISSSPHETKVAITEDGQAVEIYVEREKEYALVGSIYKGRVTRVLPGMQSAFVDIGLDRDGFLYVSDFVEDIEEYDRIVTTVEDKVTKMAEQGGTVFAPVEPPPAPAVTPPAPVAAAPPPGPPPGGNLAPPPRDRGFDDRGGRHGRQRGRRGGRGRRGQGLPESKFAPPRSSDPTRRYEQPRDRQPLEPTRGYEPIILPGESLAKYRGVQPTPSVPSAPPIEIPKEAAVRPEGIQQAVPVPLPEPPPTLRAGTVPAPRPREPVAPPAPAGAELPAPVSPTELEAMEWGQQTPGRKEALKNVSPEEHQAEVVRGGAGEIEKTEEEASQEAGEESRRGGNYPPEDNIPTDDLEAEALASAVEAREEKKQSAMVAPPEPETIPEEEREMKAIVRGPSSRPRFEQRGRRGGQGRMRGRQGDRVAREPRRLPPINEMLKPGNEIIVQIAKEPLGKKGARITSHVALPGRYLVYMPTVEHIGVSRKIGSEEERARLRRLVLQAKGSLTGGFIVRTAAGGHSDAEIQADIDYLSKLWSDIRQKAERMSSPSLLHRDLDLIERILRDQVTSDFTAVWLDNEEEYARVVEFVNRFQSSLVNRVKLYTRSTPIFEEMGIQQEIDKALRPKVWLKSGGYIVINHTEALVAIDVNTGKFVGRGSTRLEDTIAKTNLEAVKEIVRQIRLRDLGGIIVIDFIDMEERKNRQKVMLALEDALREDKSPSKILAFNDFGLVAITRKRTKQSLERTLCQPCPYCTGSGMVKSIPTICYEVLDEARKMAGEIDGPSLTVRAHPEIAKALKGRESALVEELEAITRKNIIIQTDPMMGWEQFEIY
ncbi:MAG TPA: Rne/Rng family ribonuclease [Candidatus Acidoferrales bacterium]